MLQSYKWKSTFRIGFAGADSYQRAIVAVTLLQVTVVSLRRNLVFSSSIQCQGPQKLWDMVMPRTRVKAEPGIPLNLVTKGCIQ